MALKRASERGEASDQPGATVKRQKTGFRVGPDNLPDGTHRRKGIGPAETPSFPCQTLADVLLQCRRLNVGS